MAAIHVAENTILAKNQEEVVPLMTSLLRDLIWPDHFFVEGCAKNTHELYKISALSA